LKNWEFSNVAHPFALDYFCVFASCGDDPSTGSGQANDNNDGDPQNEDDDDDETGSNDDDDTAPDDDVVSWPQAKIEVQDYDERFIPGTTTWLLTGWRRIISF